MFEHTSNEIKVEALFLLPRNIRWEGIVLIDRCRKKKQCFLWAGTGERSELRQPVEPAGVVALDATH